MHTLFSYLKSFPYQFDHVVIASSGNTRAAEILCHLEAKSITVIEPDAAAADFYQQLGLSNRVIFNVIEKPLASEVSQRDYYLSNPQGYSSLLEPKNITQQMPGLSFDVTHRETLSIDELLKLSTLDPGKNNLLVLDINGFEAELLDQQGAKILEFFSCVAIRTSYDELYLSNCSSITQITNVLENSRVPFAIHPESAPPFVAVLVNRNESWYESKLQIESQQSEIGKVHGENEALRLKNNELKSTLEDAQQVFENGLRSEQVKSANLNDINKALEKEKVDLQENLNAANEVAKSLENALNNTQEALNNASAEIHTQSDLRRKLEQQLEEMTQNAHELNQKNEALVTQLNATDAQFKQAGEELTEARLSLEHANSESLTKSSKIDDFIQQINGLTIRGNDLSQTNDDLVKQVEEKSASEKAIRDELGRAQTSLEEAVMESQSQESRLKELVGHNSELMQKVEKLSEQREQLQAEFDQLSATFADSNTENLSKSNQLDKLTGEVTELKLKLKDAHKGLEDAVNDSQAKSERLEELSQELSSVTTDYHNQEQELANVREANGLEKGKLEKLTAYTQSVELKCLTLTETLEQDKGQIAELSQMIEQISKEKQGSIDALAKDKKSLLKRCEQYEGNLAAIKEEFEAKNTENKQVESQLSDKLAQQSSGANSEIERANELLAASQQEVQRLTELLTNSNAEKASLEETKRELDFRQQKLDLEVAKVEAQLELIKDVVLREKAF